MLAEKAILDLQGPVLRVTGYDVPFPYWKIEHPYLPLGGARRRGGAAAARVLSVSPYRNPRVLLALAGPGRRRDRPDPAGERSGGRSCAPGGDLAIAVVLWIALMGILRLARRG